MITNKALSGLAARMADSLMNRDGLLTKSWSYDYGVVWRGMEALYNLTGDKRYFAYIQQALNSFIGEDGSIRDYRYEDFNLDLICDGRQLLYLYKKTGDPKYFKAAQTLRKQLRNQPRTTDGGFWHKKCYPSQMWLDGLHMASPFYLEYALMAHEDEESLDDVGRQLILAYQHTLDKKTGLNRHAWDESRQMKWADKATGQAAHSWGRAVGWYMTALIDCLEMMPKDVRPYNEMLSIFQRMSDTYLSVRCDGVWMQVLDCPDRTGNYAESSGSCLIDYALLKGARLGLLTKEQGEQAQVSYRSIIEHFVFKMENGELFLAKCCQGAGLGGNHYRDGSYAYYVSEPIISYDHKGTGAFLQAACEMERTLAP